MSQEREFLRERAARSGITADLAAAAVEACTGDAPRSVTRFDGGWGAVPFWVTAADGIELVVRVAFDERPYETEASVIQRVRAAGIPAPEVVGVCRVDGRPASVLVRADGVPLRDLLRARGADDPELSALCRAAGAWLARIHAVDPDGLDLTGPESAADVVALLDELDGVLAHDQLAVMNAAARRLDGIPDHTPTVLAHCDFGADHVLVADGRITAIIDWERADRADPARDVAWWYLYDDAMGGGAAAVRAGYGPRPPGFDERVDAWAFAVCIGAVHFQVRQDNTDGVANMIALTAARLARSA
jgi:aminoglycoside phosphotransferase (APT) family kinase protein